MNIEDAVAQMRSHCRMIEDLYKQGVAEYESFSAREVLYKLGFEENEADEVLQAIGKAGFNYCLDPKVECPGTYPDFEAHFPPRFACVWGVDQLRSRLDSI